VQGEAAQPEAPPEWFTVPAGAAHAAWHCMGQIAVPPGTWISCVKLFACAVLCCALPFVPCSIWWQFIPYFLVRSTTGATGGLAAAWGSPAG